MLQRKSVHDNSSSTNQLKFLLPKNPISLTQRACVVFASLHLVATEVFAVTEAAEPSTRAEEKIPDIIVPKFEIPHISQGKGNSYCGPVVFMTALQAETGINLSDSKLIPQLAGLTNTTIQAGKIGCAPKFLLPNFRVNFKSQEFNQKLKLTDPKEAQDLALKILREELIPDLQQGHFYHLQVDNGYNGHAILITAYDSAEDKLEIYDPVRSGKHLATVEEIAKIWPIHYPEELRKKYNYISEDRFYLTADQISPRTKTEIKTAPVNCVVPISLSILEGFVISKDLKSIPTNGAELHKNIQGIAYWQSLSKYWEAGRRPEDVPGVATAVKIKVAANEPVLVLYSKGQGDFLIAAVSGYRGGIANPEAEIRLTVCSNGKLNSKWISSKEFFARCIPKSSDGKYCAYLGFPTISLAARSKSEIASKE